jgi:hypothetical protein
LGGDRLVGGLFGAGTLIARVFLQVQRLRFGFFNGKYLLGRRLVASRRLFGFSAVFYLSRFLRRIKKEIRFLNLFFGLVPKLSIIFKNYLQIFGRKFKLVYINLFQLFFTNFGIFSFILSFSLSFDLINL